MFVNGNDHLLDGGNGCMLVAPVVIMDYVVVKTLDLDLVSQAFVCIFVLRCFYLP